MDQTEEAPAAPLTLAQAWELYFANHPEVLASWAHQNNYPPRCSRAEGCGCPEAFDR